MVEKVISDHEIYLGTTRFPLSGKVQPRLLSRFPEKVVFGDYSYENEQFQSNLILSDQRGGIGIENMGESADIGRHWYSTCNTSYKNHLVLPPLATEAALTATIAPSIGNSDCEAVGTWTGGVRHATPYHGTYGWSLTSATVYQDLSWSASYQGQLVVFKCWVKSSAASNIRIQIDDGVGTSSSSYHSGGGSYEQLIVSRTLSGSATRLRVQVVCGASSSWFDYCFLVDTSLAVGAVHYANFNGKLYMSIGPVLYKLNAGGTAFNPIWATDTGVQITDLCATDNLFIALGADDEYWYMDTNEAFTEVGNGGGGSGDVFQKFFVEWDDKLFGIDETGQLAYAATPTGANPTWTNSAKIKYDGDKVNSLFTYRDAGGDIIIYAATRSRLWALDFTNAKFVGTELKYPDHVNAGKGFVHWRSALYTSVGLEVRKYITGSTATMMEVGLNNDDGLPVEYNGEIVNLVGGHNCFYALVDSSQVSGTSNSTVMAYDENGWQCLWEAPSSNGKMTSGIVSTAVAYRLWFNHSGKIYYLPLQRGLRNSRVVETTTYASSGTLITSWFDAGTVSYAKLATRIRLFCRGMSAAETVTVKYRLDQKHSGIATGWLTLGVIEDDGETEFIFGNTGEGKVFKAIQFRFDLARGDTDTNSPDIQGITFSYLKLLGLTWGWDFTINCGGDYCGKTPRELEAALLRAANADTLLEFTYRNDATGAETHYVKVHPLAGIAPTGDNYQGCYRVSLIAP